ncbi:MAG: putative nucleotide-diphospho-sugar transferase [Maritimibacter sp.]
MDFPFEIRVDGGMKTGVVYVATGGDYLALAQASARSLRAFEPEIAIDVFTDDVNAPEPGLFDQIHLIENPHRRSKVECYGKTRFERTLYLDCDTLVLGPLGDLFDILERFDMAFTHDMRRNTKLVQTGYKHQTPYAFPQLNGGVILYRGTPPVRSFMEDWARRFAASGLDRDQPTLRDLLWETDLRYYVLPPEFNLRRVTMLDAWEPGDVRPTILHSHRLMDHMQGRGAAIETVPELVEAERAALRAEWEALGGRDVDPVKRFSQKRLDED